MSNPIEAAVSTTTAAPKAVFDFAKTKTFAFIVLALILIVVAIRFRNEIVAAVSKIPVLGTGFRKLVGAPTAAVLIGLAALCLTSDAFASAGAAASAGFLASVPAWVKVGAFVLFGALGASYQLGQTWSEDLKAEGGDTSLSITPGTATVTKTLKIQPENANLKSRFKRVQSITLRLNVGIDQAATGGSVIEEDELYRVVDGIRIFSPILGEILDKKTATGPNFKHVLEFVSAGHQNIWGARAQIAAADGDTAVSLYMTYFFAPQYGVRAAQDFGVWMGWLDKTQIEFTLGTTTALDAVSTGMVTEATCNIQGWTEHTLDKRNAIPVMSLWRLFTHNASSKTIYARDWLGTGGLSGPTIGAARVAGVYELFDVLGLGGPDGADNILTFQCDKLGWSSLVQQFDAVVAQHLRTVGYRPHPKGGVGTSAVHDRAGNPYTMDAAVNAGLNNANLGYIALRTCSPNQELVRLPLFPAAGDLEITQTYTTTPTSGNHQILVNTIKSWAAQFRAELAMRARQKLAVKPPLADGNDVDDLRAQGYRDSEFAILPTELE